MEGRVNYLVVGIFVALFLTGIFGFAFWLMKYSQYEKMDRYLVYFDESVGGLNKDASVKYMGVDAGIVEDIKVAPHNTQLVAVYLKIKHDIKIKEDMQATLKFYGMTGLAYVEIFGHDPHAPLLKAKVGEIPVIKSAPSIFARLDETLAKLTEQFSATLARIDRLLNDQNLQHLQQSLAHIDAVTQTLDTHKTEVATLIQKAIALEEKATRTLAKIDRVAEGFGPEIGRESRKTLQEIKKVMQNLNQSLRRGDYNLKKMTAPVVDQLTILINRLNTLSDEIDETIEQFRESPSDLLFKHKTPKPGPGEK